MYSTIILVPIILSVFLQSAIALNCPGLCALVKCAYVDEKECLASGGVYLLGDGDCNCCNRCVKRLDQGQECGPELPDAACGPKLICCPETKTCLPPVKCPGKCYGIECPSVEQEECVKSGGVFQPADGDKYCCDTCLRVLNPGDKCSPEAIGTPPMAVCGPDLICCPKTLICEPPIKCNCDRVDCPPVDREECVKNGGVFQPADGDKYCCDTCLKVLNPGDKCSPEAIGTPPMAVCGPKLICCPKTLICEPPEKCPGKCDGVDCPPVDREECVKSGNVFQPADGDKYCCDTCLKVLNPGDKCSPEAIGTPPMAVCGPKLTCCPKTLICEPPEKCPGKCDGVDCLPVDREECVKNGNVFQPADGDKYCCDTCLINLNPGDSCSPLAIGIPPKAVCGPKLICCPKTLLCEPPQKCDPCALVRCAYVDEKKCLENRGIFIPADGIVYCCDRCEPRIPPGGKCSLTRCKQRSSVCDIGMVCCPETLTCEPREKCPAKCGKCDRVFCPKVCEKECIVSGGVFQPADGDKYCCDTCLKILYPGESCSPCDIGRPPKAVCDPKLICCPKTLTCEPPEKCCKCDGVRCDYVDEKRCVESRGIFIPADGIVYCCDRCEPRIPQGGKCSLTRCKRRSSFCDIGLVCCPETLTCEPREKCPAKCGKCDRVFCPKVSEKECIVSGGVFQPADGDKYCCDTCLKILYPGESCSPFDIGRPPKAVCDPKLICCPKTLTCEPPEKCCKCDGVKCDYVDEKRCLESRGIFIPADGIVYCCDRCIPRIKEGANCTLANCKPPRAVCDPGLICCPRSITCERPEKCPAKCDRVECPRVDPKECIASGGVFQPAYGDLYCCDTCLKRLGEPDKCGPEVTGNPPMAACDPRLICCPKSETCSIPEKCDIRTN